MNNAKSTAGTRYAKTYRAIRSSKILSYSLAILFFAMAVGSFMETNGDQNLPMFFIWCGACVGSLISVRKIKRREELLKTSGQADVSANMRNQSGATRNPKVNLEPSVYIDVLIDELEEAIKLKHGIK